MTASPRLTARGSWPRAKDEGSETRVGSMTVRYASTITQASWTGIWRSYGTGRPIGPHLRWTIPWRVSSDAIDAVLSELVGRLTDNFPYFHPGYAGQMLKPPHPVAMLAYALAQTINPNNHANDGGPATAKMEFEVVAELAAMFGFDRHLGHLTSGGTVANLEALWVGRQLHPGKAVAYSSQAHYTHGRMAGVLGVPAVPIPVDSAGRMDLNVLESRLATGEIGTVVATAGTTSFGSVDPIPEMLALAQQYGVRLHVDAAYGGYYRLLADSDQHLAPEDAASFRAIRECDSVVVDPHKHGLQPLWLRVGHVQRSGCRQLCTGTIRPTPISPMCRSTWGKSAWSAPGPVPRQRRCGPP